MNVVEAFNQVRRRIEQACERAGRDPNRVRIVAVSKGHGPEAVRALAEAGHRLFGENRVQEAKAKIQLCPSNIEWHMIGHLQRNKVKDALQLFRVIHSVDSVSLAQEINKWAEKFSLRVPILLEVNVSGEASKFGFSPERLLSELQTINGLPRLEIIGLMTMAPWTQDPEKVRPVFRKLRELKEECEQRLGAPLPELSMGMTNDFEVAVEEGATMVRIGTAIFGESKGSWRPLSEERFLD